MRMRVSVEVGVSGLWNSQVAVRVDELDRRNAVQVVVIMVRGEYGMISGASVCGLNR